MNEVVDYKKLNYFYFIHSPKLLYESFRGMFLL